MPLKDMLLLCGQRFEGNITFWWMQFLFLEDVYIFSVRLTFPPNFLNSATLHWDNSQLSPRASGAPKNSTSKHGILN